MVFISRDYFSKFGAEGRHGPDWKVKTCHFIEMHPRLTRCAKGFWPALTNFTLAGKNQIQEKFHESILLRQGDPGLLEAKPVDRASYYPSVEIAKTESVSLRQAVPVKTQTS